MKTRLSALAVAAILLSGCTVSGLPVTPGTTPGAEKAGTTAKPGATLTDPKTGKVIPNQPVEPLNGINFKPITSSNAQFVSGGGNLVSAGGLNGTGSAAGAPAPTAPTAAREESAAMDASFAAPSSAGAVASAGGGMAMTKAAPPGGPAGQSAGGAYSGNVWSAYGFGYYFGGGGGMGDQMALVSLQEAETAGSTGSFQEIVAGTAAPVVKSWAADARLVESGSTLDNNGKLFVEPQQPGISPDMISARPMPMPGMGGWDPNANWRLVYASKERREVLQFTVKADKTTIIRMRWAELDLAPERVLTDSSTAVRSVIAAITDKGGKGEEEKTGLDYFLGFKFEQPKTGEWDGDYQKTEVLYEVPKDARWNVTLTQVMGKLVWDLNWNAPWNPPAMTSPGIPMPMIARAEPAVDANGDMAVGTSISARPECAPMYKPESNSWVNYWGQAMVDAETGTLIRFTRPTKTTYTQPQYDYGCAVSPPMPGEKPMPVDDPNAPVSDVEEETKKK